MSSSKASFKRFVAWDLVGTWRHTKGIEPSSILKYELARNTPHRRPDKAPLVATGFPVDGQISPR